MKELVNAFFNKPVSIVSAPNYIEKEVLNFLKNDYKKNNHPIEEFNLVGIRDSKDLDKDVWNDYLCFFTADKFFITQGTTESGVYYTKSAERVKAGTFHLNYGFHEKIWCIGTHKGYEAFVNDWRYCKPTKGWRDANFNFVKDLGDIEVCDYFGINFHRAHPVSIVDKIGKYSAGCQVVRNNVDFQLFLKTFKNTNGYKQNRFSTVNYKLYKTNEFPIDFALTKVG